MTHVRVRIRGLETLVFRKILHTYLMSDPLYWPESFRNEFTLLADQFT